MITPEAVWKQLRALEDKMFGTPLSVVDVGLIYDVEVRDRDVYIKVAVFNKGHLQINSLSSPVRQQILAIEGVGEVRVNASGTTRRFPSIPVCWNCRNTSSGKTAPSGTPAASD